MAWSTPTSREHAHGGVIPTLDLYIIVYVYCRVKITPRHRLIVTKENALTGCLLRLNYSARTPYQLGYVETLGRDVWSLPDRLLRAYSVPAGICRDSRALFLVSPRSSRCSKRDVRILISFEVLFSQTGSRSSAGKQCSNETSSGNTVPGSVSERIKRRKREARREKREEG